jgi:hypothetical protein
MTTKTAFRGNFSSTRSRFALAATGAMLCAGFAGGLALHQASTPHRSAGAAALSRPAADTIGGYAEFLRDRPATAAAQSQASSFGFAADGRPMGGYAEWLRFQAQ